MASPLDAPSPDGPPHGLYGHRPRGTTAGLRHHPRPFRHRDGARPMAELHHVVSTHGVFADKRLVCPLSHHVVA